MSEPEAPKGPFLGRVWGHLRRHPWTKLTSFLTIVLAGFSIADPRSPVSGAMMVLLGVNQLCQHLERTSDKVMPGWVVLVLASFCIVAGVAIFLVKLGIWAW